MTSGIFSVWPVSSPIFVVTIVAFAIWIAKKPRPIIVWSRVLSCFAFPFVILIFGTIYAAGPKWQPQPFSNVGHHAVSGLLVLQLILSAVSIFRSVGSRFFVLAIQLWGMLISLSAGFIASMSISGRWL